MIVSVTFEAEGMDMNYKIDVNAEQAARLKQTIHEAVDKVRGEWTGGDTLPATTPLELDSLDNRPSTSLAHTLRKRGADLSRDALHKVWPPRRKP
jgi:hypothetical protein